MSCHSITFAQAIRIVISLPWLLSRIRWALCDGQFGTSRQRWILWPDDAAKIMKSRTNSSSASACCNRQMTLTAGFFGQRKKTPRRISARRFPNLVKTKIQRLTLWELTSLTGFLQTWLYVPRFYTVSPSFKVPLYQRFYSLTFMEFQRVLSVTP